jgi:hypothetical protein
MVSRSGLLQLALVLVLVLSVVGGVSGVSGVIGGGSACPDKILDGYSIFRGGEITFQGNVADQAACCELCHGDYHDECVGWEFINTTIVHTHHNCDIMSKLGVIEKYAGRVSGIGASQPTPPPSPPPPQVGQPCNSDGDCDALWGSPQWRCLERKAVKSAANDCHMHATMKNTTCACSAGNCQHAVKFPTRPCSQDPCQGNSNSKRLLVIGDSISEGMNAGLASLLAAHNWSLSHNPGNGDNTNFGAHCVPEWVQPATEVYDVISFQFGLHDIAYDEERMSVEQYTKQLTNITNFLVGVQKLHKTKLLWVKTTPVPTVPTFGNDCNSSTNNCLNPARFDSDVRLYNAAADKVIAASNANGARISTVDLYSFVLQKCGGQGYANCTGFQLPMNVHYTPAGWAALAAEMRDTLLAL